MKLKNITTIFSLIIILLVVVFTSLFIFSKTKLNKNDIENETKEQSVSIISDK